MSAATSAVKTEQQRESQDRSADNASPGVDLGNTPDASLDMDGSIDDLLSVLTTAETQPDIKVDPGCNGQCQGCPGCQTEEALKELGEVAKERVAQEQTEAAYATLSSAENIGSDTNPAGGDPSLESIDDQLHVDSAGTMTPEIEAEIQRTVEAVSESVDSVSRIEAAGSDTSVTVDTQSEIEVSQPERSEVQRVAVDNVEMTEVQTSKESDIHQSIDPRDVSTGTSVADLPAREVATDSLDVLERVQVSSKETGAIKQVASMLRQTTDIPAGLASKILKANLETLQSSSQATTQMSDPDVQRQGVEQLSAASAVSPSEVQEVAQQRVVERISEIVQKDADLDQTSATVVALAREGEVSSVSVDIVAEIEIDKITEQIEVAIDMKDQSHSELEAVVQEVQLDELKGETVSEEVHVTQETSEGAEVVAAAEVAESPDTVGVTSVEHETDVALQIDEQIQEIREVQIDSEAKVETQADMIAQDPGAAQDRESLTQIIEEVIVSEEVSSEQVDRDLILDEVEQSIEDGASTEEIQELIAELVEEQISSTQQSLPSENLTETLDIVKDIQKEIVLATDGDRLEMLDTVQDAIQTLEANQVLPAEEAARLYSLIAMTLRKKKARGKRGGAIDEMTELEMRQELAQELADLLNTLSELEDITELGMQSLLDKAVEQEQAEQSSQQSEETETAESEGIMMSGHHSGPKAELDIALMQEINNGNKYTGEEDEQPSIAV